MCVTLFSVVLPAAMLFTATGAAQPVIVTGSEASTIEDYAARELQRYLYQLTGSHPELITDADYIDGPAFFVGRRENHSGIAALSGDELHVSPEDPGPEGYVLRTVELNDHPVLIISGSDAVGVLYGVYSLLDDYYDVGFHLGGDVLPPESRPLVVPEIDERKAPLVAIRGFLPWTNFPQSATVYSWEDWKFIIDQAARMRMNFIHIHSYSGELGHNENFANFELDGFMSRVWMGTARAGHAWAGPAWDSAEYRYGAADLFDDYDFGAESALHNETLSNREAFRKGASMFQRVIAYAHTRGVKIGLGLDIDTIPDEYGVPANDPRVVEARVDQIVTDYPNLDFLICFRSELINSRPEMREAWEEIFTTIYESMAERSPGTRLAVAGWGLAPEYIEDLPDDVISGPISAYSDKFEDGSIYGDREYWGCPWLERDFQSSQYYYPYDMHLSNTIEAWQNRAPNMNGLYTLTWRLTDAVDAKMSYIAKAPWDHENRYDSSYAVYYEYARRHYGEDAAEAITEIINENEPFASGFAECMATEPFTGSTRMPGAGHLLNIHRFLLLPSEDADGTAHLAAEYDAQSGTQVADSTETSPCVGFINAGDWLRFDAVDFGEDATVFKAVVASDTQGGEFELRLDDRETGPVLGNLVVTDTGGWQNWVTLSTPIPPTSGVHTLYMNFLAPEIDDREKAEEQLAVVADWIERSDNPEHVAHLKLLHARLGATLDHIILNREFPGYSWEELPGRYPTWVQNFTHRVTDISSLGNVQSHQNRFVNLNFFERKDALREGQIVKAPIHVEARGTRDGARITWAYDEPNLRGFHVYRDEVRLTDAPLPPTVFHYEDHYDGVADYRVSVVDLRNRESPQSLPYRCKAGSADTMPPHIVVVSPPVTGAEGRPADVTARILDGRVHDQVSATLYYRAPGQDAWASLPMTRRVRSVFNATVPGEAIGADGIEYYIAASDGANEAVYPPAGADNALMLTAYPAREESELSPPSRVTTVDGVRIEWQEQPGAHWYRIYRGTTSEFEAGPATRVTYVAGCTTAFRSNGFGFDGSLLRGSYYYRVTAVDATGTESAPTASVEVVYP